MDNIYSYIINHFGSNELKISNSAEMNFIEVIPGKEKIITSLFSFCRNDSELLLDFFENLICVDTNQDFCLVYQLYSMRLSRSLNIKIFVERYHPKVISATKYWGGAFIYEQETSEMFGIVFEEMEFPLKTSFFLPENWSGYPLRKDYVFPESFDQIEHRRSPARKDHAKP